MTAQYSNLEICNQTLIRNLTSYLGPSSVQKPTVAHSARDDFLKVYWPHAAGDFDRYEVVIKYNNTVQQRKKLNRSQNECVFDSLVSGRLYTVTVSTWSGDYETSISTDGRTCESKMSLCQTRESFIKLEGWRRLMPICHLMVKQWNCM